MRRQVAMLGMVVALTACAPSVVGTPTTPSPPSPTPSRSAAALDMTQPGVASGVVAELLERTDRAPVVKLDINASSVTMNILTKSHQIEAYSWIEGSIVRVDSDVMYVTQSSFDPHDFNISDVGALFEQATELGATTSAPELQIVEYDPGQVLMTVTTRPESATVFFRSNGTPINHVSFATPAGLKEGMKDAIGNHPLVYAVGLIPTSGVYADVPGLTAKSITRRLRQAKLPAYSSVNAERIDWQPFDSALLDAEKISQIRSDVRVKYRVPSTLPVGIAIDGRYHRSGPTITFTYGASTVVTDLNGTDITAWVLGQ